MSKLIKHCNSRRYLLTSTPVKNANLQQITHQKKKHPTLSRSEEVVLSLKLKAAPLVLQEIESAVKDKATVVDNRSPVAFNHLLSSPGTCSLLSHSYQDALWKHLAEENFLRLTADACVLVEDAVFVAHRFLMMHHSVVVQERILRLQGSSASGWPLTIRILGVPVDNVRVVLRWMYTYDLELLPTTALSLVDVYNTAKALQMKALIKDCIQRICQQRKESAGKLTKLKPGRTTLVELSCSERHLDVSFWEMDQAALKIQAFFRKCICRKHFQILKGATIVIQAAYRGYRTRKYLEEVKYDVAAAIIQLAFRRYYFKKMKTRMAHLEKMFRCSSAEYMTLKPVTRERK